MLLTDIEKYLEANVLSAKHKMYREVINGCGSDLMSDVLAFSKVKAVLLTGLINQQTIRTAEMMDFKAVIFVRGKEPSEDIIKLAEEKEIVIFTTKYSLFTSCGLLYSKGLRGEINQYED